MKSVETSDLPELKRVAKSSGFSEQQQDVLLQQQREEQQALTRNMLMNIILRPGGGDKTRALPRPQVSIVGTFPRRWRRGLATGSMDQAKDGNLEKTVFK
jgi:hypothetical protein